MNGSVRFPAPSASGRTRRLRAESDAGRIVAGGLLGTLGLIIVQAASQAIDFGVFDLRFVEFNADKHYSVFGIASLVAQSAVAAGAFWRGRAETRRRPVWWGLATLVALLVLLRGLTTFNATLLSLPLAGVFVLLAWLTWRDARVRGLGWAGLLLLVVSLALHKVGLAADSSTASDFSWGYQLTGMLKHGCELAGWMLLATEIAAGAREWCAWGARAPVRVGLEARLDDRR